MAASGSLSAPMKLTIRLLLTIATVYILSTFVDRIFFVEGGLPAYIIIGSLLTIMNVVVRPLLHLLLLPFKLFLSLIVLIAVNTGFLWITERIAERLDPDIVVLEIDQGLGGWLLVAIILGVVNWGVTRVVRRG